MLSLRFGPSPSRHLDYTLTDTLNLNLTSQALNLYVFEPRYLHLVRQCLHGSRRFAMMANTPRVGAFGTEVEVVRSAECHYGTRLRISVRGQ